MKKFHNLESVLSSYVYLCTLLVSVVLGHWIQLYLFCVYFEVHDIYRELNY